jgi:DNA phosphorothioation-associated DGQHR protein 1
MSNIISYRPAIKVSQRFGYFYVAKFTAAELLKLSYPDPLRKENEQLRGHQRIINEERRKEILKYIESVDCAFPSSIILAANFPPDKEGQLEDDDEVRWDVVFENGAHRLKIPDINKKMAVIIDGQHRVLAFEEASPEKLKMELICSVYLDLPSSLQAFLFATINSNQKPVPKNIAYELFGFDLASEEPETWSPDKLAISLCRKLNKDEDSPFKNHIVPGAVVLDEVGEEFDEQRWRVSTACIVDCILRLITSKPKDDKYLLYKDGVDPFKKRSRLMLDKRKDKSPLRELYINGNDGVIYLIIVNFFNVVKKLFEKSFENSSALSKTIGIQGLFDVLRYYVLYENKHGHLRDVDFKESAFRSLLEKSETVDFSDDMFMKFSGVGRGRVKDAFLVKSGHKELSNVKNEEFREWLKDN